MPNLPRLQRYLESLPRGLDSYETHVQKAVLVRQYVDEEPKLVEAAGALPPLLATLVASPPPVNAWIPEAHGTALMIAGADVMQLDENSFVDFIYRMNVKLLRGPLYRVMMMMVSPAVIMRFAGSRWGTFHRGVKLHAELLPGSRGAKLHMVYPTHLMSELMARAYSSAFRAAIEASGGEGVRFTMASYTSTTASFDGTWR